MKIPGKKWDKLKWAFIKRHLGYTNEEMEMFKANPKNEDVLDKGKGLLQKEIVIEVVASKGCNSQHKDGDKIFFDGAGNLLTDKSPQKISSIGFSNKRIVILFLNQPLEIKHSIL